jgi:hypothetical protein
VDGIDEVTGRRNVGTIDHIVLAYRSRESQEEARQEFHDLLGVDDWVDLGELPEFGIRILISWKGGLELLSPTRPGSLIDEHLAGRGEGFYSMVFGVANLDDSIDRLQRAGHSAYRLSPAPDEVLRRLEVSREASIGEVGSIPVLIGEFKPRA